jgi:ketosteroid isomerase-like protein
LTPNGAAVYAAGLPTALEHLSHPSLQQRSVPCVGQADPDAQVGVKEGGMAWAAAWNAGNAAGIAALYSDDARLLPPNGDEVQGREAIEAYWQSAIEAMPGVRVTLETKELHNLGDVAVEVGSYANTGADGECGC